MPKQDRISDRELQNIISIQKIHALKRTSLLNSLRTETKHRQELHRKFHI